MSDIDYEAEVKKVYPDAACGDYIRKFDSK
jgi:hypothetical protein